MAWAYDMVACGGGVWPFDKLGTRLGPPFDGRLLSLSKDRDRSWQTFDKGSGTILRRGIGLRHD